MRKEKTKLLFYLMIINLITLKIPLSINLANILFNSFISLLSLVNCILLSHALR